MCGIHVQVTSGLDDSSVLLSSATATADAPEWLRRRGPDHHGAVLVAFDETRTADEEPSASGGGGGGHGPSTCCLQASVLQMRSVLVPQPVQLMIPSQADGECSDDPRHLPSSTAYLAWNGEVYERTASTASSSSETKGGQQQMLDETWDFSVSDTEIVARLVTRALTSKSPVCAAGGLGDTRGSDELDRLAASIKSLVNAEFAFCVVRPPFIYYGRDAWGRRSLVCRIGHGHYPFQLASVVPTETEGGQCGENWMEVPPGRVYCFNLHTHESQERSFSADPVIGRGLGSGSSNRPLVGGESEIESVEAASRLFEKVLLESVRRRIHGSQQRSGVSILFSGGVDSVVLAALALRILDETTPLYLVNVEFFDDPNGDGATESLAADTLSARASYEDLVRQHPKHAIRYISEQVRWKDIQEHQPRIRALVSPKSSVMDLNIGAALWFAAGASPTRVVLTGLGADEQLGGYGRHRKAWDRGGGGDEGDGARALQRELHMDQERLWERNLGRDDRVLSDHGKEARFPFLDASVVDYLRSLPVQLLSDYSLPPGHGDKRILRVMAERLGCTSAAVAVKRAIQFGSRMAQVCDKKRFGSRRKASGDAMAPVLS